MYLRTNALKNLADTTQGLGIKLFVLTACRYLINHQVVSGQARHSQALTLLLLGYGLDFSKIASYEFDCCTMALIGF